MSDYDICTYLKHDNILIIHLLSTSDVVVEIDLKRGLYIYILCIICPNTIQTSLKLVQNHNFNSLSLLGLIEHHGVFINSGHYVSYIRQNNKWYHCDDKHITETNLLTLSNNVYLVFYAKEIDIGT